MWKQPRDSHEKRIVPDLRNSNDAFPADYQKSRPFPFQEGRDFKFIVSISARNLVNPAPMHQYTTDNRCLSA